MKLTGENILSKLYDRYILYRYVLPFTRGNKNREITLDNTLCLFCQPRGGSTWLAEILLNHPGSVLIDEPLWRGWISDPFGQPEYFNRKVPAISDLNFFYHQHIPEDEKWVEAYQVFEDILAGRIISKGLYEEQGFANVMSGGIYITKFCYANMLMPWLVGQFDFKAVLLTRHPCAVVASQMKYPLWEGIRINQKVKFGNFPFQDIYRWALARVGLIDSKEKYLALIWALNFKHTAMNPKNNQHWLTISYEKLLTDYQNEIDRIDRRFGLALSDSKIDFKKPSKSTRPTSFENLETNQQLHAWEKVLTKKQIHIVLDVLEKFEIDIYSENPEPDYKKLYINENLS